MLSYESHFQTPELFLKTQSFFKFRVALKWLGLGFTLDSESFKLTESCIIMIIFLPLSHLIIIWGRRNTASCFTLLYSPSSHHPLLSLTYHSSHSPSIFSLAFLFLHPSTFIPITLLVTCVSLKYSLSLALLKQIFKIKPRGLESFVTLSLSHHTSNHILNFPHNLVIKG